MLTMRKVLSMTVVGIALCWAGQVGAAPGGTPGSPTLAVCTANLNATAATLATCTTNLTTETGLYNTCTSSLGTCTTNLNTSNANLTTCATDLNACNAAIAVAQQFPATGQTTCYDSSNLATPCTNTAGQDGNITAGAALSYTSNADGTITDNNTGLVWEKKTTTTTCGGDIHCVLDVYTWGTAFTLFIDVLNDVAGGGFACFAGHCDWRLPNVKELQSIVDFGRVLPSIDPLFGPTATALYWSSSSNVGSPALAWSVNFSSGLVRSSDNKSVTLNHVRAVRGGL